MFGDERLKSAPSPSAKHLLLVNEVYQNLDEEHHNSFHYIMDN